MNEGLSQAPAGDPASEQGDHVQLLLVIGPGSSLGDTEDIPPTGERVLGALAARLTRIDTQTEHATLEALRQPCEAVVLDPGVLEHYSGSLADALLRLEPPAIIVRDRQESRLGAMGARRVVSPMASASVSGGGTAAYDGALEAAATIAWERRQDG